MTISFRRHNFNMLSALLFFCLFFSPQHTEVVEHLSLGSLCFINSVFAESADTKKDKAVVAGQHSVIGNSKENAKNRTRHPDAQWFPQAGLGLFLHWGISSVEGRNISWPMKAILHHDIITDKKEQERIIREKDWGRQIVPAEDYWAYAKRFNPEEYNPEIWLQKAKDAGFEYAVLTAKHHEGFAMWPSAYGNFNTKNYMGGKDLVKDYIDACRKAELKVGLYFSAPDWYFDKEHVDFVYGQGRKKNPWIPKLNYKYEAVDSIKKASPEHLKAYAEMTNGQITELLTKYGKIDILWFDGKIKVADNKLISIQEIRDLQPGIVINPRMHKDGDFKTFERHLPDNAPVKEGEWAEFCNPWNGAWPYIDRDYMHFNRFLSELIRSRIQGVNYLISIGPKGNGDLDYRAYNEMEKLQAWMKINKESIYCVSKLDKGESCSRYASQKGKYRYVYLLPEDNRKDRQFKDELVTFKGITKPKSVTILNGNETVESNFSNGILRIKVKASQLTKYADVVKIEL